MNKAILCAALALLFCWALPVQAKENKTLKIVYVEWDCATASSNLAKAVLEDRLGYKVELLPVTQPILWTSLASGDADAMVTAWLPDTHKEMYAKVKNQVEMLGKLTGGARLGLAVPDYVPLKSVEELSANAAKFKNRIIGIDPGAGIMQLTEKLLKDYNIKNMELVEGSGTIMTSSLADAIRNKEWIVVTAWSPHWMFGRWQLHYLDDPKASLGREEGIYKVGRKGLKKDHPAAWAFLTHFSYTGADQLQQLMAWNQEKGTDPLQNARRFMKAYPEQVNSWLEQGK
ncbi:glycine betaine ABC transporter substrate-binding protein [Desulfovibrio legallii]|uniref:Glycine betaine ABC transporter substrate-binding protein n=4 Tax=Desulfovibrio TaxID=872 RepID=A0A6H3FE21_9BACT|nr:glycine betaine ABC transporter substrate-binding protein [Desulfovibrio legallii]RHH26024.1 glycine/betaine ABC transporter substrate-binding protein [Desulfovibrio sp. AM18-2]TBH79709.1 glycine betaine ABC transporter substrate-binding protein [Desulfovibrio legallii]CAI3222320.1 Glycine betaine ABC transporter, substrate-binding protein OtaC [Desulfovibrio diazotrophicus]